MNLNLDSIIISHDELIYYILNGLISKYKKKYLISDKNNKNYVSLLNSEILELIKYQINQDNLKMVTSLSLSYIFNQIKSNTFSSSLSVKNIKATFFNKDGLFNPKANYKNCILPYKDKNKNIKKTCNYAKEFYNEKELNFNYLNEDDIICPTELNKNKQISKFGYCPEVTTKNYTDAYHLNKIFIK